MAFFSRILNIIPSRRSVDVGTSAPTQEKSGSDNTDETIQGTDEDLEQQREEERIELQAENLDRRRAVRTLPRKHIISKKQRRGFKD